MRKAKKKVKVVKQCIVHHCTNKSDQGLFVGDLCSPCYDIVACGDEIHGEHSQAFKNARDMITARMVRGLKHLIDDTLL